MLLHEIGRLSVTANEILDTLQEQCGIVESDDHFAAVVKEALGVSWTRDPFDRLLVGTAILHRAPFVTRDHMIGEHFENAVW